MTMSIPALPGVELNGNRVLYHGVNNHLPSRLGVAMIDSKFILTMRTRLTSNVSFQRELCLHVHTH